MEQIGPYQIEKSFAKKKKKRHYVTRMDSKVQREVHLFFQKEEKLVITHKSVHTWSKAVCFVIVKSWKWSRCPSTGRSNKQWSIHTREHSLLSNSKE